MSINENHPHHPFRYAYEVTDHQSLGILFNIYKRTCQLFDPNVGLYPEMPEVWLVSSEHLKDYANKHNSNPRTITYGLYNYKYPNRVFLSNSLKFTNKMHASIVAHEFVHYLQYNSEKYPDITNDMLQQLEDEADDIMVKY